MYKKFIKGKSPLLMVVFIVLFGVIIAFTPLLFTKYAWIDLDAAKNNNLGDLIGGIPYFVRLQGGDNVKYWIIKGNENAQLFASGKQFMAVKSADVLNEVARMQQPLTGRIHFALLNDNTIEPIKVTLKIVAIEVIQEWATREIKDMFVNSRQEAYLK